MEKIILETEQVQKYYGNKGNITKAIDGKDITTLHGAKLADFRREKLGFIFQNFNLLDTLTAYDNIALALSALRVFGGEVNNFMLSFCPHAFVVTVVSFGIIYLLSMVLNVCIISGVKLIDLLNAERKNEELKKRNNVVYGSYLQWGFSHLREVHFHSGRTNCFREESSWRVDLL